MLGVAKFNANLMPTCIAFDLGGTVKFLIQDTRLHSSTDACMAIGLGLTGLLDLCNL